MIHDFAELVKALAFFKEPMLIILGSIIAMLFYLLRDDRKIISEKDACIREFAETAASVGEALTKLSTLVEIIVYGKGKR